MIISNSESTINYIMKEYIPELENTKDFPIACYEYNLLDRSEPWHWHEEFELCIIRSGKAKLILENKEFIISAGNGYFINSGILHTLYSYDNKSCQVNCFVFNKSIISESNNNIFYNKYLSPLLNHTNYYGCILHNDILWENNILMYIMTIMNLFRNIPKDYEIETRTILTKILSIVIDNISCEYNSMNNNDISKIKSMLLFIWQNYDKNIDLKDIANSGMMSKNSCLLYFKNIIGISPIQYLKNYRLSVSVNLLVNTNKKISEIYQLCGFQDQSYFIKSFQQKYNYTPLQYRKKL